MLGQLFEGLFFDSLLELVRVSLKARLRADMQLVGSTSQHSMPKDND
jgi:hypothetical protein